MEKTADIIALTGFMGSGKSSVGRELARMIGADFIDLDELIVGREARSIREIFEEGEAAFRRAEFAALKDLVDGRKDSRREGNAPETLVLALGGGTMTYPDSLGLVLENTVSVYLRAGLDTIRRRIGPEDPSRPLYARCEELLQSRAPLYSRADFTVDTDCLSIGQTASRCAALIASSSGDSPVMRA